MSNQSFRTDETRWGRLLICNPLEVVAPHVFTTSGFGSRAGEASDNSRYHAIADALGIADGHLRDAHQVHGIDVFEAEAGRVEARPHADILLTREAGVGVLVRVADCVPILLADRHSGAVAAVHAGWRGTCLGAAAGAVRALAERYHARPEHLVVAIGPSIGPCCYQVGSEVRAAFAEHLRAADVDRWFTADGDRWRLDLWAANRDQLVDAGVREQAIHVARECTFTNPDVYESFRRDGAAAGRMVAAIRPG